MKREMKDWSRQYDSESELSAAVAEYLENRGDVLLTRVEASHSRNRRGTETGSADWQGCTLGGVHLECELKNRTGKSRPEQVARSQKIRRLGGVYRVCRSVRDVHEAIQAAMRESPDRERVA